MSRGPGHVERAVSAILDAKPNAAFTTEELCRIVYPHAQRIAKKHRVAVLRAVSRLANRDTLGSLCSEERGGAHVYFNTGSVKSYMLANRKAGYSATVLHARIMFDHGPPSAQHAVPRTPRSLPEFCWSGGSQIARCTDGLNLSFRRSRLSLLASYDGRGAKRGVGKHPPSHRKGGNPPA
jgi:hypothetical protein